MNRTFIEKLKMPEGIRIPFLGGYWYRFASALDRWAFAKQQIPENPLNSENRDEIVICSMTSFPARIQGVHQAIKSLMLQTYAPDRILLWLAEEQFPGKELPESLTDLCKHGLEICWCHDMYGHKKYYYPVLNQKENELVITFDDDILYPPLCIERLINKHREFPHCMVCERAQVRDVRYDNPGRWTVISSLGIHQPTYSMNPSPGGGCLIPYGAMHPDALNEEKFRQMAYKNDDLWYMFMCAENGTRTVKTRKYHRIFTVIEGSQVVQMALDNIAGDTNRRMMKRLKLAYPKAWQRILTNED